MRPLALDEQNVIFRKGHGNVADISWFCGPLTTRGHGTIGKDEVKDVEEYLSQPAQWCPWLRFFGLSVRCVRSASNGSDGWNGNIDGQGYRCVWQRSCECHRDGDKCRQWPNAKRDHSGGWLL